MAMTAAAAAKQQQVSLPIASRRALDDAVKFARGIVERQLLQYHRLDDSLPLPRVHLPRLPIARLMPAHIDVLADALAVAPFVPGEVAG
jgi:hypothetical protein